MSLTPTTPENEGSRANTEVGAAVETQQQPEQNWDTLAVERVTARQDTHRDIAAFPDISYADFQTLTTQQKQEVLSKNRIVNTDTYNRTMNELLSDVAIEGKQNDGKFEPGQTVATAEATYSLQLRRSPHDFLVACGVEDMIDKIVQHPISQAEFDFAVEHYKETNVPFFNEDMWRWVVEENNGILPFTITGVKDGTAFLPGEDILTITGPSEMVAHFEHMVHRVFYESLVATKARVLTEILEDPNRFIEVGLRGADSNIEHLRAVYAMYVGGGLNLTSNDAASGMYPTKDIGTIGHRYVQSFDSVDEAFRHAIENLPAVTLLVDLVETYQGIDLSFDLKQEYRDSGKPIYMRLDSGAILEQVRYFLQRSEELGMTDSVLDKVVVEGIESIADIVAIEEMIISEFGEDARQRVVYGAGGLLISQNTSRSDASTGLKLSEYTNARGDLTPTNKFSNSPGKESHPGKPRTVIVNGQRITAQAGEELEGDVEQLFEVLYNHGIQATHSTPEEAQQRTERTFAALKRTFEQSDVESMKDLRAAPSPETLEKMNVVNSRYGRPHVQQ